MDSSARPRMLVELARICATATDIDELSRAVLPLVAMLTNARAALVVRSQSGGYDVVATAGLELDATAIGGEIARVADGVLVAVPVPDGWAATGIASAAARRLPDGADLVLAWTSDDGQATADARAALDIFDGGLARLVAGHRLHDLVLRVDSAQQLANMGDYDWHIATDTNEWSDQLYRVYGHEPQSFNASYEQFLSLIHPDDRERITSIHQQAYATGEPYEMIERIVRPDGETRYLSSNGQVIQDGTGKPVRMRGTCIDITDRILAEQARERLAARFEGLVESAPDAILVVDRDGAIVSANARAGELLGGAVVGHNLGAVLPDKDRVGEAVAAVGLDGRALQLDVRAASLDQLDDEARIDGHSAVFLQDAAPRLANEALAANLTEARVRRRQALEVNDNVMQGLTAAAYSMELGDPAQTAAYLERTLAAARMMMNDWLNPLGGGDLQPGDLVRSAASTLDGRSPPVAELAEPRSDSRYRLLIADDYADMRQLLRLQMRTLKRYEVVGEAGDGAEAVRLAAELQPHVVLLDLAMPGMDGLQALPLILAAVKGVRVIALSGFDHATMAEKVLAAGAACYVEKGMTMNLAQVLEDVLAGA